MDEISLTTVALRELTEQFAKASVEMSRLRAEADRLDSGIKALGGDASLSAKREEVGKALVQQSDAMVSMQRRMQDYTQSLRGASEAATGSGGIFSPGTVTAMATAFMAIRQGVGDVVRLAEAMADGAAQSERRSSALAQLGGAYDALSEATNDTIDETDAFNAQQRLLQAGLDLTEQQFVAVMRAAREYAIATGTDTMAAVDRLTGGLISGSERGLRPFGLAVQGVEDQSGRTMIALLQLTQRLNDGAPSARTFAEAMERAKRETEDAKNEFLAATAKALGLKETLDRFPDTLNTITAGMHDIAEAFGPHGELRGALDTFVEFARFVFAPIIFAIDKVKEGLALLPGASRTSAANERGVGGVQGPQEPGFDMQNAMVFAPQVVGGGRGAGGGGGGARRDDVMRFTQGENDAAMAEYDRQQQAARAASDQNMLGINMMLASGGAQDTGQGNLADVLGIPQNIDLMTDSMRKQRDEADRLKAAWTELNETGAKFAQGGLQSLTSGFAKFIGDVVSGSKKADVAAMDMLKGIATWAANALIADGTFKLFKGLGDIFIPGLQGIGAYEIGVGGAEIGAGLALTAIGAAIKTPVPNTSGASSGGPPEAASTGGNKNSGDSGPVVINLNGVLTTDDGVAALDRLSRRGSMLGYTGPAFAHA